jgi:ATP-dependent DNA ligase
MTILSILEALAKDSSRLAKEKILRDNASNETLKRVFKLAYDKKILFWTRTIPDIKVWGIHGARPRLSLDKALDEIEATICTRKKTGNAANELLNTLFQRMEIADAEVVKRVILGDLRVGATRDTANRIWPGLISKPSFMLCSTETDEIVYPAISQTKEDGARCRLEFDGDIATLTSRADNEIEHCGTFNAWAHKNLQPGDSLDGELVCFRNGKRLSRKEGNGIVNKAIKGTISPEEAQLLVLVAWDLEDKTLPYHERFERVQHFTGKVQAIESREVDTYEEAMAHFKEARRAGLEGTVVKNRDALWQGKRTKDQAKFKAEIEAEFKVVGFEYGKGKNAKRVGALFIESECGEVKCDVGIFKDFKDSIRDELLVEMPKVVTVRYNERIQSKGKGAKQSLFLPRVIALRWDKTRADTLADLIKIEAAILE